jgi:transposase-like protein/transposase Tn5 family protein
MDCQARGWAREEFGHAELGDARRTERLVRLASCAISRPGGRITEVCESEAERQGAYDFLESERVGEEALQDAAAKAAIRRVAGQSYAFVAVDGTSLSLSDCERTKDFGAIGAYVEGGRGLKVIHAYIVDRHGVPSGMGSQVWWTRPDEHVKKKQHRPLRKKETVHWIEAINQTSTRFASWADGTRPWFVLDREGDCWSTLRRLLDKGELFTVRGCWDRRLKTRDGEPRVYLRQTLQRGRPAHVINVDVPEKPGRRARCARFEIRAAHVTLDLKNSWTKVRYKRALNAVLVRERGTTPRGEEPLEWLLLTSHPIAKSSDLELIVYSYVQRWRIEELHKTWKSGSCRVEDTQLRTKSRVIKWATIMAAVASRIERIKRLSREQPDAPASLILSSAETRALIILKRIQKKRTETIPDAVPTMAQAVRWIADLGGYTGKSSGGPPGSITIRRGMDRIAPLALAIQAGEM